jgi:acyl-CoA synthetase (AMP-forming)/AMP-acid ligase II
VEWSTVSRLIECLSSQVAQRSTISFLPESPEPVARHELLAASERSAAWVKHIAGSEAPNVAFLMDSSFACLSCIFGVWRLGGTVTSIPTPARGMTSDRYFKQVARMCDLSESSVLLLSAEQHPLFDGTAIRTAPFEDSLETSTRVDSDEDGSFIQFTSGSTGDPKGVHLSMANIEANLLGTHGALEPLDGEVMCSWLPLSHDMGLFGAVMACLSAMGAGWERRGDLVLIKPEWFAANPGAWLQTCSERLATTTVAPDFALRIASRLLPSARGLDLSPIRALTVGSEPVSKKTLNDFAVAASPFGFDPLSFSPAYGMAEATLAISLVPPRDPWTSITIDKNALRDGEWVEAIDFGSDSKDVVSCGRPIPGLEIRIADDEPVGTVQVRGPSLFDRYVGSDTEPIDGSGWFHTSDLGHIEDGELYVLGRSDDVIVMAGRNYDPTDVESVAGETGFVRLGNCAAVLDGEIGYAIVAESPSSAVEGNVLKRQEFRQGLRTALVAEGLPGPTRIVYIPRGTLLKTPSGKIKRRDLASLLESGEMTVLPD